MKGRSEACAIAAGEVPPFCFLKPGMTPEDATVSAVKAMQIPHCCDALAVLWKLRRIAREDETDGSACTGIARPRKNQPRPAVQAVGLINRGGAQDRKTA